MTQITLDTHVSDIVTQLPQSTDLFRKLRIDFCCGGKIALKDAAEARNLGPEEVFNQVKALENKREQRESMHPASFGDRTLVSYIQEKYHDELREELPAIAPYVTRVARVHGDSNPHLLRIEEIYKELRDELLAHTEDEDENVFPLILEFLKNPTTELKEQIKPHVLELEEEHENAGRLLNELREITNDFTPPADACGTYRTVYARLEQLEKDTFDHVHLENNVLFDRVREYL
ncbi:iron-sulfur cluster repair di-iron protein [Sporosarcina pasteurii]|uniref:Cell wall-related protein ScdA n=1 Tax=Sporosarcina pasteurii TaxID=1474 RepID=A0A380CE95_SPOPA|nr:iron-sulfur cluster repair di-iron protein [Sporosarcina pasteurii]MDS9473115.1 iron-sulfur cluster repair di-iron protein [Sporosarcina pasteurii]QBQ04236.1 iron-sulfur cluster repair di-iron protein [Sporosarcina pasteurii]SUJ17229.1 Cell wall-related protein ScdA [Sporosarcina pasteurii]